jgi:hypothetical protein
MKILNRSIWDLYYQLDEAELSLAGKTAKQNTIDKAVLIIQAQSDTTISFPSILWITAEPMTGRAKLKLKYGKHPSHLNHTFDLVAEPIINVAINEKHEPVGAMASMVIKELKYT